MRVLVLPKEFPSEQRPNAGIFILRRCQALRDLGHEIEVVRIVPYAPPIGRKWRLYRSVPTVEHVDGFTVHTVRALFAPRMIGMEYLPLQVHHGIAGHIDRFRPNVLHASFLIPCGQIAVRQHVPTVVTAHGSDAYKWPNQRPGLRRAAVEAVQRATVVTAVSFFIRDCVEQLAPRPVHVIWNGADERYFGPLSRERSRSELDLPQAARIIGFVGNVLEAKGVFDLIDAAALVAGNPLIALAGTGPDAPRLAAAAESRGVQVRFFGHLDAARIAKLFGACDVVTLPSHGEGLPNVVCEAMLSARAVVATSVGGTPEILENERTGLLVPPRAPAELAVALQRLLDNVELRERFAAAARTFACEHLTWRVSALKYEQAYHDAASAS